MTDQVRELIEYYNMISLSINSKEKMIAKLQTEIDCLRETKGSITNILAKGGYRLNPSAWTEKPCRRPAHCQRADFPFRRLCCFVLLCL